MPEPDLETREQREQLVEDFFAGTGKQYDRVVWWTTYGLDKRWKKRLLAHVPKDASRILDLASGTGIVLQMLHDRHPDAALVGVDITAEYLEHARKRFEGKDLDLTLQVSNAELMELDGAFDAVVSSYIPKYVDPDTVCARLADHVRPGTVISLHDFGYPRALVPKFVWNAHMWFLKQVVLRIMPAWKVMFDDRLADLIRTTRWHRRWPEALERHGWTDVQLEKLTWRAAYVVSARKA